MSGDDDPTDTGTVPADEGTPPHEVADRATVRATYDRIADHFAGTRTHPWPEVVEFLEDACGDEAGVGLDVGCGNGRHAAVLARHCRRVLGIDASPEILAAAGRDLADGRWDIGTGRIALAQGDASRLPVADSSVDVAVYVATVHHLPTARIRVASLDELARVLAPGGRALVSAWSTVHDRFDREEGFDATVDWTLPGDETVPRFYHVYDPGEFEADLAQSDLTVHGVRVSSGNCYGDVGPP